MNADSTSWTIQKILQWTTQHFSSKGITSSRLDSELLLSHTLNCKRLDLYLRFDQPLKDTELKSFKELVLRRSRREPIAYILGHQEFYGRQFNVSRGVLIPRPETEHVVDETLRCLKSNSSNKELKILDVGCGSGALGLSIILESPSASLVALDSSSIACAVTKSNAKSLGVEKKVSVIEMPFMNFKEKERFDIIVSNPPYISLRDKEDIAPDVVQFEPPEALFGGETGSEILAQWIPVIGELLKENGFFLCEFGFDQGDIVKRLAEETKLFKEIEILKDYSGHSRILKAKKARGRYG